MARQFTAASSHTIIHTGTPLVTAFPFTLSCWYKPTTNVVGCAMAVSGGGANDGYASIITLSDGTIRAQIDSGDQGATVTPASTAAMSTGVWYRLTVVFASATDRRTFLGNAKTTSTSSETFPAGLDYVGIGCLPPYWESAVPILFANGHIADAAIWDAALSDSEVAQLVAGYSATEVRPQNLTNWWPLLGNTSPEIDPVGGQAGTVTGAAKSEHPRIILPHRRGSYVPSAGGGTTYAGTITETGTLAHSSTSLLTAVGTLTEAATLASSVPSIVQSLVTFAEAATLGDSISGGLVVSGTFTESATLTDNVSGAAVFVGTFAEAATLGDAEASTGVLIGTLSNSGTLAFSMVSTHDQAGNFQNTLTESATLASSFVSTLVAKGTIAEASTLASQLASTWVGYVTLTESATLGVTVSSSVTGAGGSGTSGSGGIRTIPLGQDYTFMVWMSSAGTGVSGLTLTVKASKDGGTFSTISPVVIDRGNGWYAVTISSTDLDTEGDFVFTVEAIGADDLAVTSQVAVDIQTAINAATARLLTLGQFLALK